MSLKAAAYLELHYDLLSCDYANEVKDKYGTEKQLKMILLGQNILS